MKERIHAFANHYFDIFRDPKATNFQVEEGFETPSARSIQKHSMTTLSLTRLLRK